MSVLSGIKDIKLFMCIDDAFFQPGLGLEHVRVVGPDLNCWRVGL